MQDRTGDGSAETVENALAHSKKAAIKDEPLKRMMQEFLGHIPGIRSLFDLKETKINIAPRRLYHQIDIPPEELSPKTGYPKAVYASNKIRTTKYTPLNFLPKNILFQFENVANIYFLAIAIFSGFSIFGVQNAGLAAVPIIAIVAITAIRDAIEDYRRQLLDLELNNTVTHILKNVPNANSAKDNVGPWRRFKKACTRNFNHAYRVMTGKKIQPTNEDGMPLDLVRTTTTNMRSSMDTSNWSAGSSRRPSTTGRPSIDSRRVRMSLESGRRPSVDTRRSVRSLFSRASKATKLPKFKKAYWKNVLVGDFVKVYANQGVPADVVVVSCSDPDGECFIDTRELDGETSLKSRQAVQSLKTVRTPEDIEATQFWMEIDGANSDLSSFGWTVHRPDDIGIAPEALSTQNFIPRGSTVRNTRWVIGYVVYTGVESKIILNAGETPTKRSRIARDLNWYVMFSFAILFILSFISGLVNGLRFRSKTNSAHFFEFGLIAGTPALTGFVDFFAALVNLQNLIPISLYVSVEIVRTVQAFFIYSDVNLYDEKIDYPCTPKSWGIGDDLGQIEYVFSDKTGTLTQNSMVFRKCSINAKSYGIAFTEAQAGVLKRNGEDVPAIRKKTQKEIAKVRDNMLENMSHGYKNRYVPSNTVPELVSEDIIKDIHGNSGFAQQQAIERFALCISLCNTVLTERTRHHHIRLNAESPDEGTLVKMARDIGYTLVRVDKTSKTVDLRGTLHEYTTLATLMFTSARKRMCVLVRNEAGRIFALVKGADNVMLSRLSKESRNSLMCSETINQVNQYASEGLRVLLLAYREVEPSFAEQWLDKYQKANSSSNREQLLETIYNELETNLTLLGGTGIEDQLQVGVPDTIHTLSLAGIKLWVLTGDKQETAISIGFSCNLLEPDMNLITLQQPEQMHGILADLGIQLSKKTLAAAAANHSPAQGKNALIVEGETISRIVGDPIFRQEFALLSKRCKSVLCCRVSPSQKAAVVYTIKSIFDVTVLAVGDGANDVSMIQEADIGIGIAGVEGRQAAMSADFAIGQFRFLKRLLLVHGRYSYNRNAELSLNILYKNFVFTLVLFWYSIFNDFDETYYFDYTYIVLYLSIFTSLPPVILGILDQDLPDFMLLKHPQLYAKGILRQALTKRRFLIYVADGIYQSAVAYFFTYFMFWTGRFATMDGHDIANVPAMGTVSAHVSVFASNIVVLLNQYRWDWFSLIINLISSLLILFWTGIYTSFVASLTFYKAAVEIYGTLCFWACVLLSLTACMIPFIVRESVQKIWFPTDVDIIREQWLYPKKVAPSLDYEEDSSEKEKASGRSHLSDDIANAAGTDQGGESIIEMNSNDAEPHLSDTERGEDRNEVIPEQPVGLKSPSAPDLKAGNDAFGPKFSEKRASPSPRRTLMSLPRRLNESPMMRIPRPKVHFFTRTKSQIRREQRQMGDTSSTGGHSDRSDPSDHSDHSTHNVVTERSANPSVPSLQFPETTVSQSHSPSVTGDIESEHSSAPAYGEHLSHPHNTHDSENYDHPPAHE